MTQLLEKVIDYYSIPYEYLLEKIINFPHYEQLVEGYYSIDYFKPLYVYNKINMKQIMKYNIEIEAESNLWAIDAVLEDSQFYLFTFDYYTKEIVKAGKLTLCCANRLD